MCKEKQIAEVKSFKVGEPLTDNADGNTEPSTSDSFLNFPYYSFINPKYIPYAIKLPTNIVSIKNTITISSISNVNLPFLYIFILIIFCSQDRI